MIRGLVTLGPVAQLAEEALGSSKVRPRGLKGPALPALLHLGLGGLLAREAAWLWRGGGEQMRLKGAGEGEGEGDWTRELGFEAEKGLATRL